MLASTRASQDIAVTVKTKEFYPVTFLRSVIAADKAMQQSIKGCGVDFVVLRYVVWVAVAYTRSTPRTVTEKIMLGQVGAADFSSYERYTNHTYAQIRISSALNPDFEKMCTVLFK